jgi:plastocyanin
MLKRVSAVAVVLFVVLAGCSTGAKAQTFTVSLDGKASGFNGVFTAFFPNDLKVHPGDTVRFRLPRFSGEPHTVTFGTLVDSAVAKIDKLGPKATFADQETSPELLKNPDVFVHDFTHLKGPPKPNKSALLPCFMDSGVPPLSLTGGAPACPKRTQPAFDGKQSFYNLGMLNEDGASATMDLSKDIAPGTYSFICLVHRGGMTAKVTVVDKSAAIDSPAQATSRGKQQLAKIVSGLRPAVDQWRRATVSSAVAGVPAPNVINGLVAEFGPKQVSVPVGGTVSWNAFFFHAFSLKTPEDAVGIFVRGADGNWTFNPKSGPPYNGPPPPIESEDFPPPNSGHPIVYDGGAFDGKAFHSTGIFGSVPPILVTYKLRFTSPGTYQLRCLVHPDMKATVKVG